jgi:hypothetical protein
MSLWRYGTILAVIAGALWAAVNLGAENGKVLLVDAAHSGTAPKDVFWWMLAAIAVLTSASLGRFVAFGLPALIGAWCGQHRQLIYTIALGGVIGGAYYLI